MKKRNFDKYENLSKILLKKTSEKGVKPKKKRKSDGKASDKSTYSVTPKGILFFDVDQFMQDLGVDDKTAANQLSKFDDFQKKLVQDISKLVTNEEDPHVFGDDFNTFIYKVVECINEYGRIRQFLDSCGIDYDDDYGKENN